jgi:hypothetical protein
LNILPKNDICTVIKKHNIYYKMKKLRNAIVIMVALAAVTFTSCSKSGNTTEADAAQISADSTAAADAMADSLAQLEVPLEVIEDSTVVVDSIN